MTTPKLTNYQSADVPSSVVREDHIEYGFIGKLQGLKYEYREDIRDRDTLEKNFREKFEALNRVSLTEAEFQRLLEEIITPDVFTAARTLRERNSFTRDDGTPLNYTLVNIRDWCKNTFEVVNQLRINTDNSHQRYDVIILINGVPAVQIELKTLKHHGLIQAFSRTNRVLNGTKPYGNILDFRQQKDAVDAAIALFSGGKIGPQAREIWLVDKAPVVIEKLQGAVQKLDAFMKSQGLDCAPEAVPNLKGDDARAAFINHFKEVQRLKTQLDQYTDLSEDNAATIEQILPNSDLLGFRGAYLETAQRLKTQQSSVREQLATYNVDQLGDLMAPLGLGWKARTQKELALMDELTPLLKKRVQGRDISGLNAYEQ